MSLQTVLAHAQHHLKTEGVSGTARWFLRRAQWRWHERRFGIRTEGIIGRQELGFNTLEFGEYGPTDYTDFAKIMRAFHPDLSSDVFVDFGAGMGRAMILAASYPFKRVRGVELSPRLSEIAKLNIERALPKLKCQDIEITTGDAAEYVLPEDASFLYVNNSFTGLTLEIFLRNIRRSAR